MNRTGRLARPRPCAYALLAAVLLAAARPAPAEESWDAMYSGGHKIGHVHTRVNPVKNKEGRPIRDDQGRELLNVQVNQVLAFRRNKDLVTMQLRLGTIEQADGRVLRIDYRTQAGPNELINAGRIDDGRLRMTFEGGGMKQEQVIAWPDDVRGPYAVEQSVARKPMQPGETRELKSFLPVINEVCRIALSAHAWEDVKLPAGKVVSLLRVDAKVAGLDGKPKDDYDMTYWFDASGQALKSYAPVLGGVEMYRTTKEAAQAPGDGKFDILQATVLKVRPITSPYERREVVYRITAASPKDDPAAIFPADRRQSPRKEAAPNSAVLIVHTAGPELGTPGPERVDDQFLRPNPLINSDDPRVMALLNQAVGNAVGPWDRAVAIKRWVFQNLKEKNYRTAFATASEVAVDLKGDCTEHSVLTAAMCRAAGIPCRVVVGLLYAEPLGGFGGHMWNEVYVNRRWVAIDATFDESEVDAVHLKLSDSSLDGVTPFDAMLPILQVSGKIKIEPLEIR